MRGKFSAIAASFLFIILTILYFVWLSPLMSDNFVFSREITPGYAQFYSGAKVAARELTIAGSFRQACEMYWTWCGRFAGNLAVYLLFMLPHWLYCLVAACGFGLYVLLLQMCVFGRAWRQNLTPGWILGLAALLWLGLPSFGEAFFWLSVGGEIALIGQAAILLPFRFALDGEKPPRWRPGFFVSCAGLFLGGICVASLDYPTSAAFPVTALACVAWIWLKNRQFPAILFCGALGLCLGGLLTLAAPGNAGRTLLTRDPAVQTWLAASWPERILSWLAHLPGAALMEWLPLLLLALAAFALWRQYGKRWFWQIPASVWLFLLPACLIHGAYLLTAWPPPRAFAGCFSLLLVGGCILYAKAAKTSRIVSCFRLGGWLLAFACGLSLCWEGHKFWQLHQFVAQREEILHSAKGVAEIPALPPGVGDRYWVLGKYLYDLSSDPNFWINRAMAAHYGLDEVRVKGGRATGWENYAGHGEISVRVQCEDNALRAFVADSERVPDKLHIYYYGEPALLCALPYSAGEKIFAWLARDKVSTIRRWLVPLLLARADIVLKTSPGGKSGKSPALKLFSDKMFWLARPGAGPASFDVNPLEQKTDPGTK